uniref:Uncharacterized protein n=1 Tax=Meloidogyne enterolobii TaxID=390850 RepID=A0A6V7WRL7_MELEN|nr:unnamed protein product [Meloidogyne enterolobii]
MLVIVEQTGDRAKWTGTVPFVLRYARTSSMVTVNNSNNGEIMLLLLAPVGRPEMLELSRQVEEEEEEEMLELCRQWRRRRRRRRRRKCFAGRGN